MLLSLFLYVSLYFSPWELAGPKGRLAKALVRINSNSLLTSKLCVKQLEEETRLKHAKLQPPQEIKTGPWCCLVLQGKEMRSQVEGSEVVKCVCVHMCVCTHLCAHICGHVCASKPMCPWMCLCFLLNKHIPFFRTHRGDFLLPSVFPKFSTCSFPRK